MSLSKKAKGVLSYLLRIGISFGLLFYLFQKIEINKIVDVVKNANYQYIMELTPPLLRLDRHLHL